MSAIIRKELAQYPGKLDIYILYILYIRILPRIDNGMLKGCLGIAIHCILYHFDCVFAIFISK